MGTLTYLADLDRQSLIPAVEDLDNVYSGDETYIEQPSGTIRPIKDTIQTVMKSVHALVFGLGYHLNHPKISFTDFQVGDAALFMPTQAENRKIWMAFHAGTPYRFLAEESLQAFEARAKNKEPRAHIVGRIVLIDSHVTSINENPFNLPMGTEYFLCFVEPLSRRTVKKKPVPSSTSTSTSTTYMAVADGCTPGGKGGSGTKEPQTPSSSHLEDPSVVVSPGGVGKSGEKA